MWPAAHQWVLVMIKFARRPLTAAAQSGRATPEAALRGRSAAWHDAALDGSTTQQVLHRYPIAFLYMICSLAVTRSSIQLPLLVRRL